jgi:hypothetical protein
MNYSMNWYAKYKQAKALPETTEPYPEYQGPGLESIDKSLKEKDIEKIFEKKPVEYLGAGYWGGAWGYQGKVKKITRDPTEFNTALEIIRRQNQGQILPFVVPVYSAKTINDSLYEILIGKAQLLDNEEKIIFNDLFDDSSYTPEEWANINLKKWININPEKIENMKKLIKEFKDLYIEGGAFNEDIDFRNVGKLNGKIVVLDVGAISFPFRDR